jgi:hypothetical protein
MPKPIVIAAVLTVLLLAGGTSGAWPQRPASPGQPYLWMPTIHPDINFDLLHVLGDVVSTNASIR